ncbi:hypothetical protein EDB80DRAFT_317050 [Ilyonectria destructans]|nr:hypothetical protein EDB80DRAFT_317050 [Ilyonectria destructans]
MVTPLRSRLRRHIVAMAQCLRSWSKAGIYPSLEIDRIDRLTTLDRSIYIDRHHQSIDIDRSAFSVDRYRSIVLCNRIDRRSNRSKTVSRDDLIKLQNPKKEGGGAPSLSESTQQQRRSTNSTCQGCFVGHANGLRSTQRQNPGQPTLHLTDSFVVHPIDDQIDRLKVKSIRYRSSSGSNRSISID